MIREWSPPARAAGQLVSMAMFLAWLTMVSYCIARYILWYGRRHPTKDEHAIVAILIVPLIVFSLMAGMVMAWGYLGCPCP